MRALNILVHDLLPPAPAQPAAEEALHLLDLPELGGVHLGSIGGGGTGGRRAAGGWLCVLLLVGA